MFRLGTPGLFLCTFLKASVRKGRRKEPRRLRKRNFDCLCVQTTYVRRERSKRAPEIRKLFFPDYSNILLKYERFSSYDIIHCVRAKVVCNVNTVKKSGRSMWRGALILSAAAILVKIMSAAYRLPYQNFAGDIGFYVYQQVYPFYALAVALGGTGFPIIISKAIAEAGENASSSSRILTHSLVALSLLCGSFFLFLTLFAEPLTYIMGDRHLLRPIRIMAIIYLFVPIIAVLRGNFQGKNENMVPTALSQISEQFVRVLLILGLSWYLFLHHGTPYQFGTAAAIGCAAAPAVSVVVLFLFFRKERSLRLSGWRAGPMDWAMVRKLLKNGCLFSVLALPLILFQLADALTVVPLLNEADVPDPRAEKGIYDRAYLVIQIGMVASGALAASIVPSLSGLAAANKETAFCRQAALALRVSFVFGLAAACGLAAIAKEVNMMLFKNAEGTGPLILMAFVLLTLALIITSSGILEAAGHPGISVTYLLIGAAVKLAGNFLLIPYFSVTGAAVATCLATGLTAWLSVRRLKGIFPIRILGFQKFIRLCAALCGMIMIILIWKTLSVQLTGSLPGTRLAAAWLALPEALIGGGVFLTLFLFAGQSAQKREQIQLLQKIVRRK
ncbi:polysaccharide biosynthesis protein [Sporolactobacillus sp. THM7-7]|nr:polysaccharide biosynthesis protein [Sporolactobacillus sp. THM7-7]